MDFPSQEWFLVDNPYQWGPQGAKGMGELVFNGADAASAAADESYFKLAFFADLCGREFRQSRCGSCDSD